MPKLKRNPVHLDPITCCRTLPDIKFPFRLNKNLIPMPRAYKITFLKLEFLMKDYSFKSTVFIMGINFLSLF